MKKTEKGAHKSGDTRWEEIQLRAYHESEMRLVDSEVHMCKDFDGDEHHCRTFYGEHDERFEEWFMEVQKVQPDLHHHLCVDKLKVCCPEGHYGMISISSNGTSSTWRMCFNYPFFFNCRSRMLAMLQL